MKNLLIKVIVLAGFFALLSGVFAMTPNQTAGFISIGMVLSLFAVSPAQSMRDGVDISEVVTQVQNYWRKYNKVIWKHIYQELQLENLCRKVPGVVDEYVGTDSHITEVLQGYQKDWTPKGTTHFTPLISKVRKIKVDYVLSNIDEIYTTYLYEMAMEDKKRSEWPLAKFILFEHLIPKIIEELEMISGQGLYIAPTVGTAGASINATDGFLTKIGAAITGGDLTPIATGVIDGTNTVDRIEYFVDQLPSVYDKIPGKILCSPTMEKLYKRNYRNLFGSDNNKEAKTNTKVDATNKEIVGVAAYAGSNRIEFTPDRNRLVLFDKILTPRNFNVEPEKRAINMYTDFKRGYGWETLEQVFVNDQL